MSEQEKMLIVPTSLIEKARAEAERGVKCCGCSGSGEAMDILTEVLAAPKSIEIAGYEGSSGLYYSKMAAVANGEQVIEPVYRVKK
jgi:uncharacterized protein YrrD